MLSEERIVEITRQHRCYSDYMLDLLKERLDMQDVIHTLEAQLTTLRNATCGTCGRSLAPDGDCYGCECDRQNKRIGDLVDALKRIEEVRTFDHKEILDAYGRCKDIATEALRKMVDGQ